MKKLFIITIVFLACLTALAGNPIKNPFGPYPFDIYNYPNNIKDFLKFQELCNKGKYSPKFIAKVQAAYEKLCSNHPENQVVSMCSLGNYYLNSGRENKVLQEEGFNLLNKGLELLPDTNSVIGDQRKELKELISSINSILGYAYLKGIGTNQNYDLAFAHYFMVNGSITAKSIMKALNVNLKEKDPDSPLGLCYAFGIGTPIDKEKAIESLADCSPRWYINNQMYADLESLKYVLLWNQESSEDSLMFNTFRDGYLKWYVDENYEEAKNNFIKAINMGFLPAMCEFAMMNLDENWKNRNENDFETYLQKAIDLGYPPASHLMGRSYLEHWGVGTPISSSGEGKAYPYFITSAKVGYKPSIDILKEYEEGRYHTKTGLAAAFGDLNEGWKGGDENSPGLLEGLLDISSAIKTKVGQSSNSGSEKGGAFSSSNSNSSSGSIAGSGGMATDSYTSTSNSSTSASRKTNSSSANKGVSSNNKSTGPSTRNCRKCGGSGKVKCKKCNGTTRMTCAGCDGRGYNTVVGAGKRKCTICYGKGTQKCTHCNGKGTEKCLGCNGKGQVNN